MIIATSRKLRSFLCVCLVLGETSKGRVSLGVEQYGGRVHLKFTRFEYWETILV